LRGPVFLPSFSSQAFGARKKKREEKVHTGKERRRGEGDFDRFAPTSGKGRAWKAHFMKTCSQRFESKKR